MRASVTHNLAVVTLLLITVCWANVTSGSFLYGVSGTDHSLFRISPDTATSEIVGDAGYVLEGLAYNSDDGFLYGVRGSDHSLIRISPYSADSEIVGDVGYVLRGLTYNSDDGFLYGVSGTDHSLFRVSPYSASSEIVGDAGYVLRGLAYNNDDGFLYGVSGIDYSLFRIVPDTAYSEIVGGAGYVLEGLAYIPEPTTLLLLGLGAVMVRRKYGSRRSFRLISTPRTDNKLSLVWLRLEGGALEDRMESKKRHLAVIIASAVVIAGIAFSYFVVIKPDQERKERSRRRYTKGYMEFFSGEYRAAIHSLNYALIMGLDDYFTFCSHQTIGDAHASLEEYDQAIEAYNKALNTPLPEYFNSNSQYAFVHHQMGNAYSNKKEYVEAISEYNRALQADSTHDYTLSDIGKAYANLGQREQAIQYCRMDIERNADNDYTAYRDLGDVYVILEEYKLAVDSYNKALVPLENHKSKLAMMAISELHARLGYSYHCLHDFQQAIDCYKSAIKEDNEKPYPHYELARIYLYRGDRKAAMELYERLKELDYALAIELLDEIHNTGLR